MARRKKTSPEAVVDPCGPQTGRLPQQWSEIDQAEMQHRHQQAALLRARGYGQFRWIRIHMSCAG